NMRLKLALFGQFFFALASRTAMPLFVAVCRFVASYLSPPRAPLPKTRLRCAFPEPQVQLFRPAQRQSRDDRGIRSEIFRPRGISPRRRAARGDRAHRANPSRQPRRPPLPRNSRLSGEGIQGRAVI